MRRAPAQTPSGQALLEREQEALDERTAEERDDSTPWYLQEDVDEALPQRPLEQHTLADRQRLPELPERPPPILQKLVEHVFTDLGLDDLTVMDLRSIEPPPALGGNLLMLYGTARSEKHLHVSADRLCRWLRSTFQLKPYADGLLGRNELKLRMRRKTRRAKMMANAGATNLNVTDDGIRTGWVCVNVGRVDPAEEDAFDEHEEEDIVGFGTRRDGVNIVVQMFTEEKRAELDLEGLWGRALEKSRKRFDAQTAEEDERELERLAEKTAATQAKLDAEPGKSRDEEEVKSFQQPGGALERPRKLKRRSQLSPSLDDPVQAANPFLSNERPLPPRMSSSYSDDEFFEFARQQQSRGFHTVPSRRAVSSFIHDKRSGAGTGVRTRLMSTIAAAAKGTDFNAGQESSAELENLLSLLQEIRSLPRADALLRLNSVDWTLLSDFSDFEDPGFYQCALDFRHLAWRLGHREGRWTDVLQQYNTMTEDGIVVSEQAFKMTLEALLGRQSPQGNIDDAVQQRLDHAFDILEDMHFREYNAISEDIVLLFHQFIAKEYAPALAARTRVEHTTASEPSSQTLVSEALTRMRSFVDRYIPTLIAEQYYITLLHTYATIRDWPGFFDVWHTPPRRFLPHTPSMYAALFTSVAKTGDARMCGDVLRKKVEEMAVETVPVRMDARIAKGVRDCLRIVEPRIAKEWESAKDVNPEWSALWVRCHKALKADAQRQTGVNESVTEGEGHGQTAVQPT